MKGGILLLFSVLFLALAKENVSGRRSLKKGFSNDIDDGPAYASVHKVDHRYDKLLKKGTKYHPLTHKVKGGLVKIKKGSKRLDLQPNTLHDQDDIDLQRLDSPHHRPATNQMPKDFKKVMKKRMQKPSKKLDKLYKKLLLDKKNRKKIQKP